MLTLAFAQITWAVCYQWDSLTGGSNGITGVWPSDGWAQGRFYWLTLTLVALGVLLLRRVLLAPLGYALRAGRDAPLRAEAIGIDVRRGSGSALCWRARWRAWRVRCFCWPRAAFRPKPWPWPSRWMAW